jgi:DNA-binding LacI/PurR family transcriptional regulator
VVEEVAGEGAREAGDEAPAPVAEAQVVEIDEAAEAPASLVDPEDTTTGRQAKVFLCERGHRTVTLWSVPATCRANVSRREQCGRQLHPIGELPEQVQKALNPLKASKKASKKG